MKKKNKTYLIPSTAVYKNGRLEVKEWVGVSEQKLIEKIFQINTGSVRTEEKN